MVILKKIRARLAALELKNTQLESRAKSIEGRIKEILNLNNDAPTIREIQIETDIAFLDSELKGKDGRISALEERVKKLEDMPPTVEHSEELTKEQYEAAEKMLDEWQNGAREDRI